MMKSKKSRLATIASVSVLSLAFASPAIAQNQAGDSLVNVQIGDVTVLAPISLAANLCDVNVNVLARQERDGGATCRATAESIASTGKGKGKGKGPGGGNTAGDSLVNVQIEDITVLAPISVAADLCDVNANVLARQVRDGGATCRATAESIASKGNRSRA